MTFEKLKEELGKLELFVHYDKEKNRISIYKNFAIEDFMWFPADGCIEDIQTSAVGLSCLDYNTALIVREYVTSYLFTPISKRFALRTYYIKLNNYFNNDFSYLGYYFPDRKYVFDRKCQDPDFKIVFTEEEIKRLPFSVDTLIKSGLLLKVPVEE